MAKKKSNAKSSAKLVTKKAAKKANGKKKVVSKKTTTKKKTATKKVVSDKKTVTTKSVATKKKTSGKRPAGKRKSATLSGPMQSLKAKLQGWLDAKKKIVLSWDCGGDETLIHGKVNKENWPWDDPDFQTLCDVLVEELQLPNAGEEFNKGGGDIVCKKDRIVLDYEADFLGVSWDDEEGDCVELPPEKRSGELELFGS